jgi:hypothetical protein
MTGFGEQQAQGLSDDEIQHLWEKGYNNPRFFLESYLRDWFPKQIPWVHLGIIAILTRKADFLLDWTYDDEGNCTYGPADLDKIVRHFCWKDPDTGEEHRVFHPSEDGQSLRVTINRNTLIMMPRGFSKTTIAMGCELWAIVYKETDFDLIVSATAKHSTNFLSSIAHQLQNNKLLQKVYGEFKPPQRSGYVWSEAEGHVQTLNGIDIMAKGAGSQIRGTNVNAKRPKRIIVDDLESKETVNTDEQRQKLKSWYYSDLRYALPRTQKDAYMIVLATLLHPEAIVKVLMTDNRYNVIVFGAIDPDGDALWPEAMTLDEINAERAQMANLGLLGEFYRELMNEIRSNDQIKFLPEHIREEFHNPREAIKLAIAMDPAISEDRRADFASIAVVGMLPGGRIHLFDIWLKRGASPREKIDKFFEMKMAWGLGSDAEHGIESIAYQSSLVHLAQEEMFRKSKQFGVPLYFEMKKITHGSQRKIERVEGILHARYIAGYITHQRVFPEYNSQLLDWPNGKKDGPDCVSMAVKLLDPVAWVAGTDESSSSDPTADVYEPLPKNFGARY